MNAVNDFTADWYRQRNVQLSERVEVLEEENRQLRAALGDGQALPDWLPHLTGSEEALFRLLIARKTVTPDAAMIALYSDRPDPPEVKIVNVFISKLRKKLTGTGVAIDSVYGQGWSLARQSRILIEARGVEAANV